MPTKDEAQSPLPYGQCPQRDRVRKVGRIGSLFCTLTLALSAVAAVIASVFLYFKTNDPRTPVLRGLFDSAGMQHPVIVALSMLTLVTWVYALWILRRLFVEFSRGIVLSVRNAQAICWLGVITIFGMFSFTPSDGKGQEAPKVWSKTGTSLGSVSVTASEYVNHRAPLVSFSVNGTMTSTGEETPSEGGLVKKFSVGFYVEYLLVGMLLLAVGWGLEQGVALQEEQDLTI